MDKVQLKPISARLLIALLLITFVSMPVLAYNSASSGFEDSLSSDRKLSVENRTLTSSSNITYNLQKRGDQTIRIKVKNDNSKEILTGLFVDVDGREWHKDTFNLSPGETRNWTFNVTRGLNVVQDNHTVTVSTYGNYTQYKFTRDLNTSNPGSIPRPHIANIEVANGTIDGEPSAVAKVTVSNPGIQLYSTKLMVFTEGTDGSFYGASVPAGENRTITVELLDERGAKVAGEARLYTKNLSQREGAIDQVEFVGRAGENTTVWNKSYQPVTAPWRNDHYVYDNESIQTGADENGLLPDLSPTQRLYAGVGILLLSLFGVKRVF